MNLGVAQVVSVVLVIALVVGGVATVYPWASSMIEKKGDMKNLDDVYNFFQTLDTTIREIANVGEGGESLALKVDGQLSAYPGSFVGEFNNSIIFSFNNKVSNIAVGDWIPLSWPNAEEPATLGLDPPSVIFGRATQQEDTLTIEYRLWYRELDSSPTRGYKITLITEDGTEKTTTTGFIRVEAAGSRDEVIDGKTITMNEIKIII